MLDQFLGSKPSAQPESMGRSKSFTRIIDGIPGGMSGEQAGGGVASVLIGNKGTPKLASGVVGYRGAAALGVLAFRAYDNWKHQSNEVTGIFSASHFHQHGLAQSSVGQREFEVEMVKTMVAAAKSDGHIDAAEQRNIMATIESMQIDSELKSLIFDLLLRDISIDEIRAVGLSNPLKSELYLGACLVTADQSPTEIAFLKRLARHLDMPPDLVFQIEMRARQRLSKVA